MTEVQPPLRIGLMTGDFPVFSETFVINMAAGLVERGHDLHLLTMSGQTRTPDDMHETVARLGLADRVHRPFAGGMLVAPFARRDDAEIRRWGPVRRAAAFAAQAGMMARLPRFDIIHCQFATLGLQAMRHLAWGTLRTRATVVHVRGQDVTGFPRVHGEEAFRATFARADLLVANCEHFRKRAIALGAAPDKVIVIGSGIDTAQFTPGPRTDDGKRLRLIAIGRLVEKKGFADAIEGVARIAGEFPDMTFDIVGDGPLKAPLGELIVRLGMGGRVTLRGAMPREKIVRELELADIMLAPSVTAASGDQDAPVNTLKEAMAMELPVVATRHGGIPELVVDGENGYLVPERSPDDLADAIRRLASDRGRWGDMGRRGRARVIRTYDQTVVMDRLLAAYRELLHPRETAT